MTNLFCVYIQQYQELVVKKDKYVKDTMKSTDFAQKIIKFRDDIETLKRQALNLLKKYSSGN